MIGIENAEEAERFQALTQRLRKAGVELGDAAKLIWVAQRGVGYWLDRLEELVEDEEVKSAIQSGGEGEEQKGR